MRFALGLIALCGCNQIFGVQQTVAIDAPYFDAPIDAPFTCPVAGETPQFSRVFFQLAQDCSSYTTYRDQALAECEGLIAQGRPGGELTPIANLVGVPPFVFSSPRLAPEGSELFVRATKVVGGYETRIYRYRRQSADSWVQDVELTGPFLPFAGLLTIGAVTAGPSRRMMVQGFGATVTTELEVSSTGVATVAATHSAQAFGLYLVISAPNLTSDGLRMVFGAQRSSSTSVLTFYADRPDVATSFNVRQLVGAPASDDPFLSEDCARLYFSAADSVLWVPRQ